MTPTEAYVVCEGFHDRAFWSGLLGRLGCSAPKLLQDGRREELLDPWRNKVKEGHYGFTSSTGGFIRVVPAREKSQVRRVFKHRLSRRDTEKVSIIVACSDLDSDCQAAPEANDTALYDMVREFDSQAKVLSPVEVRLDGNSVQAFLLRWQTPDEPKPGLPNKQTLERLVSASLAAAYPNRAEPVQVWLDGRPDPPPTCAKEHTWSYIAGWYADCGGYEAFFDRLWGDGKVVPELMGRLDKTGVLRVARLIAEWS